MFPASVIPVLVLLVFILYYLTRIENLVSLILDGLSKPTEPPGMIDFFTTINGQREKVVSMFLKVSETLPMSIEIKDGFGNAAKVDGVPAWAVTDTSLGILEVAADGMSAILKPLGLVGVFKVQVSADADLGEGIKSILGELDVEMLPGEAVSISISAGTPV